MLGRYHKIKYGKFEYFIIHLPRSAPLQDSGHSRRGLPSASSSYPPYRAVRARLFAQPTAQARPLVDPERPVFGACDAALRADGGACAAAFSVLLFL